MVVGTQADPNGWVTPPLNVEECVRSAVLEAAMASAAWAKAFGVRFEVADLLDMSGGPLEKAVRACASFVAMDACDEIDARAACVSTSYIMSFPFRTNQMTGEVATRHVGDAVELASVKASILLGDRRSVVCRRRVARLGRDPSGEEIAAWCDSVGRMGTIWGEPNFGRPVMRVEAALEWLAERGVPWAVARRAEIQEVEADERRADCR